MEEAPDVRVRKRTLGHTIARVPHTRSPLGVSHQAASNNLARLEDAGIVREITDRRRNKVFLADEILSFLGLISGHEAAQEEAAAAFRPASTTLRSVGATDNFGDDLP